MTTTTAKKTSAFQKACEEFIGTIKMYSRLSERNFEDIVYMAGDKPAACKKVAEIAAQIICPNFFDTTMMYPGFSQQNRWQERILAVAGKNPLIGQPFIAAIAEQMDKSPKNALRHVQHGMLEKIVDIAGNIDADEAAKTKLARATVNSMTGANLSKEERAHFRPDPVHAANYMESVIKLLGIRQKGPVLCSLFARSANSPVKNEPTWMFPGNGEMLVHSPSYHGGADYFHSFSNEQKFREGIMNNMQADSQKHYKDVLAQGDVIKEVFRTLATPERAAQFIQKMDGTKYTVLAF